MASHEHPRAERKIYRDLLPQFPNMSLATALQLILKVFYDGGLSLDQGSPMIPRPIFDFMGHDQFECGE